MKPLLAGLITFVTMLYTQHLTAFFGSQEPTKAQIEQTRIIAEADKCLICDETEKAFTLIQTLIQQSENILSTDRDKLSALMRKHDEKLWTHLREGEKALNQHHFEKAKELLLPIYTFAKTGYFPISSSPISSQECVLHLKILTAQAYAGTGNLPEALLITSSHSLNNSSFSRPKMQFLSQCLLLLQATLQYQNQTLHAAQETLFTLISLFPSLNRSIHSKAYTLLTTLALQENKQELGLQAALALVRTSQSKTSFLLLGCASFLKNDLNQLTHAINQLPSSSPERTILEGLAALLQGHYKTALANLEKAQSFYPNSIFIQKQLTKARIQLGLSLFFTHPSKAFHLFNSTNNPTEQELESESDSIQRLLEKGSYRNVTIEMQLKALETYHKILDDHEPETLLSIDQLDHDPFIQHLQLHLCLKAGKLQEAYTNFLNLRAQCPDYEGLYHAWYNTAQILMDSSDWQPVGLDLMHDLSEQKLTSSPYGVLSYLTLLEESPLPLLPDPLFIETSEDKLRAGLSELILAGGLLDEVEIRTDSHELESALDKALSLIDQANIHLLDAQSDTISLSTILLSQFNASSLELKALTWRCGRMKSCTLEKERFKSCASKFQAIVEALTKNEYDIDPEIIQRAQFDSHFASLLHAAAQNEWLHAENELDSIMAFPKIQKTIGSKEMAQLMLARQLMTQNDYETAIKILTKNNSHQNPSLFLEMAIERSICYRKMGKLNFAIYELSKVINSEYALSARVQAALMRAEVYMELKRPDLAYKQLKAVQKKGGQWALLAERKLIDFDMKGETLCPISGPN